MLEIEQYKIFVAIFTFLPGLLKISRIPPAPILILLPLPKINSPVNPSLESGKISLVGTAGGTSLLLNLKVLFDWETAVRNNN